MKMCPRCGKEVIGAKHKIYCSDYCRVKMWFDTHPDRAKEFSAKSRERYAAYGEQWARENPDKVNVYALQYGITNVPNHSTRVRKLVREYFAEEGLGRLLQRGSVVHHIDSDITNNDPLNWWIFDSQREHSLFHSMLRKQKT
jgi:hypothetical protein